MAPARFLNAEEYLRGCSPIYGLATVAEDQTL